MESRGSKEFKRSKSRSNLRKSQQFSFANDIEPLFCNSLFTAIESGDIDHVVETLNGLIQLYGKESDLQGRATLEKNFAIQNHPISKAFECACKHNQTAIAYILFQYGAPISQFYTDSGDHIVKCFFDAEAQNLSDVAISQLLEVFKNNHRKRSRSFHIKSPTPDATKEMLVNNTNVLHGSGSSDHIKLGDKDIDKAYLQQVLSNYQDVFKIYRAANNGELTYDDQKMAFFICLLMRGRVEEIQAFLKDRTKPEAYINANFFKNHPEIAFSTLNLLIATNNFEMIDFLDKKGLIQNKDRKVNDLVQALSEASMKPKDILHLINKVSDLNGTTVDGWTPLLQAIVYAHDKNDYQYLNEMLKREMPLIKNIETIYHPLELAIRLGNRKLIHVLLSKMDTKAELNKCDIDGYVALNYAIQARSTAMIDFLHSNGASLYNCQRLHMSDLVNLCQFAPPHLITKIVATINPTLLLKIFTVSKLEQQVDAITAVESHADQTAKLNMLFLCLHRMACKLEGDFEYAKKIKAPAGGKHLSTNNLFVNDVATAGAIFNACKALLLACQALIVKAPAAESHKQLSDYHAYMKKLQASSANKQEKQILDKIENLLQQLSPQLTPNNTNIK